MKTKLIYKDEAGNILKKVSFKDGRTQLRAYNTRGELLRLSDTKELMRDAGLEYRQVTPMNKKNISKFEIRRKN